MAEPGDPDFIVVGQVVKLHGVRGELYVQSLSDRTDDVFRPGRELRVAGDEGEAPDERLPRLRISEVRPHRTGLLLRVEGLDDRAAAAFLHQRYLLIPFAEAEPTEEGEYFHHELVGMEVCTVEGNVLGRVREVHAMDPADLLLVSDGERERFVPFSHRLVRGVERETGRILIDPPPGFLEL